jgi:hypothetical protein
MPVSSYQAQQVLAELRKRLGLENKPSGSDSAAVRVSTISIIEDDAESPAARIAPPIVSNTVVDGTPYPPAVERELERRAGVFMQPNVPPRQSAKPIPKTGRRPAPPTPPRSLGEGD